MHKVVRPLMVFGIAGGMSLLALQMGGGESLGADRIASAEDGPLGAMHGETFSLTMAGGYDLSELEDLEVTLYHVEESYVEPNRIDYEKMYVEALEAVEQRVPVTMFRREPGGRLLHVEVGSVRTVLEVDTIVNRRTLHKELQRVAAILEQNLQPTDIPMGDDAVGERYAQIEYAMVNGVLGTLDPHSRLLPPEASKEMDVENQGEFGGLGITIVDREGKLTIEYPLPDTPAQKAGLRADDQIVRIDGVSTINMSLDEAVGKLRGPVGAEVVVEIMREGLDEPLEVRIKREKIKLNPVEATLLDGGIGYVAIQSFNAQVESDLHQMLARLERENGRPLKGLVLDLRDNPGGYLNQAEAVSDAFLERGTIVSQVDGTGRKTESYDARNDNKEPRYPIAVLVNAQSASASEIVSGALRNNERAIIIGERTYGKGSVQNLHQLADSSKLKLTISKYLTPGDKSIQAVGIPADIELVPVIAEKKKDEKTGREDTIALMYFRERARREADADKHLEQVTLRIEEPSYSLRYLRPADPQRRKTAELDLSKDYEVQFARDVLLAVPAGTSRRADVLAAAAPVVEKHRRDKDKAITTAFTNLGLDWGNGPSVTGADLDMKFDLGPDGVLVAGHEENVALEVTNKGAQPIYRLSAIATFEGDYQPREFFFGRLDPGETARYEQPVTLAAGHPTELTPVTFTFRDTAGKDVAVEHTRLPVQGQYLPKLSWQMTFSDAQGGDGDGIVEIGEKLTIDLVVTNDGKGNTEEAFGRIKNKSGRALDIVAGTVEPGRMLTAAGEDCPVVEAGMEAGKVVGDASKGGTRVTRGDPPKYQPGCKRVLAPGESWTGTFEVLVKEDSPEGLQLALDLGDAAAYDHASIVRNGFYSYFTQRTEIELDVGKPLPKLDKAVTPEIQVTKAPGVVVEEGRITVSGVVTDDVGLAHVEVYNGDDKVFFQGSVKGASVRSVPFTADLELEPGLNTVTVLATDVNGYTDTNSVVTFYAKDDTQAHLGSTDDLPALQRVEN